jgi:hypothetical protein
LEWLKQLLYKNKLVDVKILVTEESIMRKLLLFTTCLLFQACYLTPSLDSSRPSVKKLNETNNIPIHNQDCLFEDDILSKNVYRYPQEV